MGASPNARLPPHAPSETYVGASTLVQCKPRPSVAPMRHNGLTQQLKSWTKKVFYGHKKLRLRNSFRCNEADNYYLRRYHRRRPYSLASRTRRQLWENYSIFVSYIWSLFCFLLFAFHHGNCCHVSRCRGKAPEISPLALHRVLVLVHDLRGVRVDVCAGTHRFGLKIDLTPDRFTAQGSLRVPHYLLLARNALLNKI